MGQVLKLMTDKNVSRKLPTDYERIPFLPTPAPDVLADVGELFLHLTSWTVPHGWELLYYGKMLEELGFQMDAHHNWWIQIGSNATTCFMAHLDTACREAVPVTRQIKDDICTTDGRSILGADDRAGVALLLHLVTKDIPGLYYLFIGEEAGCIGSGKVADESLIPSHINKAISFDRKGYHDVITHQCGMRTCSDAFAEALAGQLNESEYMKYEADDTGLFTDSKEFSDQIAECTNISVGYDNAHSQKEWQDLRFLRYLAGCLLKIDWEALPVSRIPGEDDLYERYYAADYRSYSEYDPLGKELDYYSKPDPYDAVNEIIDAYTEGAPLDDALISLIVSKKKEDTIHYVGLVLDELFRMRRVDD
jgi:hypothetical protein